MPRFILFAWIATFAVTIIVAARKQIPLSQLFGWINTKWGARIAVAVIAGMLFLILADAIFPKRILGQRPVTWAALEVLVWLWICIAYNLFRAR